MVRVAKISTRLPAARYRLACHLLLIVACLLIPCLAEAAVVIMKNGDRITGRIVKMQDRRLEVDVDYSSTNAYLDWEKVKSIVTDRPMSIKLYGNVEIPDNVGIRIRDRIILYSLEEGGPIRLKNIRDINLAEQDYYGYLSAGGNQTSGNTDTEALNVSGTLAYRQAEHRFILDGKYNRAQAGGRDTANNGAFSVRYDYFLGPRLSVGGFNLTESDQFQDLTVRNTAGVLLGYDIFDNRQQLLTIGAGPAAVYQDFTTTPTTITPSGTWVARYELRLRGDDVILFHKQQGFLDATHGNAVRWNADQGIRVKIISNWRVNFEYDVRYNSEPVANKKTTDINIIFGFSYDIKP